MDRDCLEVLLARGLSMEEIGRRFGRHPSTVSYWMKKYGLVANYAERHSARGAIARERLEELVDAGMSVSEIAAAVDRCKTTVRHWLRRYDLRTRGTRNLALERQAKEAGFITITLECRHHGDTDHVLAGDGTYRCKRCRSEAVARRRRRLKALIVAEAGGRCCICGYDRYVGALQFHHVDPSQKRFTLSQNGVTLSLAALQAEARKCVLVCANCHAELEAGDRQLPDTVSRPE